MKEPHQAEAAAEPQQPQRKLSQKRAALERPDRNTKKGRLEPLDTEDIPQEAASPADEQALSTGAVKPETPAKVTALMLPQYVLCIYFAEFSFLQHGKCPVRLTWKIASGLEPQFLF